RRSRSNQPDSQRPARLVRRASEEGTTDSGGTAEGACTQQPRPHDRAVRKSVDKKRRRHLPVPSTAPHAQPAQARPRRGNASAAPSGAHLSQRGDLHTTTAYSLPKKTKGPHMRALITGAGDRRRTCDLRVTSALLYRLSYSGAKRIIKGLLSQAQDPSNSGAPA